ncbi:hypothetical protein [Tenuibacillus multivorans]|uniref:Uncharacterized protein n=1 Tax=Tenuibacillus multivorans TaxID=237069 RepID=A0A1H0BQF9_9BACI|nr:hypothetical protein [Tenuibacillus multivorans]GEL77074.1 hypothetical protein TMU01_13090 [Tenuibacillus multivorans]SDN47842.1 hypothetical protein SAMN05216498_2347 [Tenuibacillus multivorans]
MTVIENPKLNSIIPFLNDNLDDLEKVLNDNPSLYIMDNMMLAKIRKDFVKNPFMVSGLNASNIVVIPEIILEEASKNLPNEEAFRRHYYEIFHILSQEKEVYVVNLELILELLQSMASKKDALNLLRNIAIEAVRINPVISDVIRGTDVNATTALEELNGAIIHNGKNAGERFITTFALVLLSMYYSPVYIFSEDVKGIYGAFRTFISNERLMDLIDISDALELIEQYKFISYESLIQSVYLEEDLSEDELMDLIVTCDRNRSRNILYSLDGHLCHTSISDENLSKWISEGIIKFQF